MSGAAGAQRLDSPEARKAGLDQYLVKLAGEIVAAQNEMVQTATRDPLAATRPLDSSKYPEIAALHRAASTELKSRTAGESSVAAARAGELSLAAAGHECGDYEHPLPYYAPARNNIEVYNVRNHLTSNVRFHQTQGYACGASTYNCADDYTRGRDYYSNQGTGYCSSPRFRDQAVVTGYSTAWIQYGEPNPEIHSYLWPYWNYGNYVQWWHATH